MPKMYRLTGEEMKNLSGKRSHGRFFSLLVAPHSGVNPKFAVVISKKIASRAVDRNRIKRRMRNALAKNSACIKGPVALVLYAKPDAKTAEYADILVDIEALFSRLKSI